MRKSTLVFSRCAGQGELIREFDLSSAIERQLFDAIRQAHSLIEHESVVHQRQRLRRNRGRVAPIAGDVLIGQIESRKQRKRQSTLAVNIDAATPRLRAIVLLFPNAMQHLRFHFRRQWRKDGSAAYRAV